MDTKSFAPYKFDATAWNRYSSEEREVCQFLVLGSEAVSFVQDIFPDYPKYKDDRDCTFRFVICDDVSAYYDYLDKHLADNKVEYTPMEFVLDLNGMTNDAEKLKSRWKYYVILNGDKNRQKYTLALLLRLFERHILYHDYVFNFEIYNWSRFFESGVYLDAKVVEGCIVKESVQTDLIKAVQRDTVESMVIAFYQPIVKDNLLCHWTKEAEEVWNDILANVSNVLEVCESVCEATERAIRNYGTGSPETIVLFMYPVEWNKAIV